MASEMDEVCGNCGLSLGSHCASSYYSEQYKMHISRNQCPGNQGRMNWDKGPGTVFKSTGKYKLVDYNTPAGGN